MGISDMSGLAWMPVIVCVTLMIVPLKVKADECGTRFTDLTSNSVLAQAVVKGSIRGFNPMSPGTRMHSANVSVTRVYKGDSLVARTASNDVIMVSQFGEEDKENCVVPSSMESPESERIFFLRQSANRNEMQMSAFPVLSQGSVVRQVKRSLCSTCIRPPVIRRMVCKDCAQAPVIKTMKTRNVKMGKRARLRCTAKAEPKATFSWTKNGTPVVSGSGGIIIRETESSSSLHFRRTFDAHAGIYTCKAENQMGEMEENVSLELFKTRDQPSEPQGRFPEQAVVNMLSSQLSSRGQTNRNRNTTSSRSQSDDNSQSQRPSSGYPETQTSNFSSVNHNSRSTAGVTQRPSTASSTATPSPTATSTITPSTAPKTTMKTTSTATAISSSSSRTQGIQTRGTIRKKKYPRKKKLKSRLSNSQLKTQTCKEKTYCLNNGHCKYVVKLDVRFCQCRTGFAGRRCEIRVA